MSREVSGQIQEVWSRVNGQWVGPHAEGFYQEYVVRETETAEDFEDACTHLLEISAALAKELQAMEQRLAQQ